MEKYEIDDIQLGNDEHSKVYKIKKNIFWNEFIVKIYEVSRINYYENETKIISLLNQIYPPKEGETNFFVMFKNMNYYPNMFTIPYEVKGSFLKFLFYDYLPKLSLFDYITQSGEQINELHAKYICYKLLISIDKLHSKNICHNNIDTSNIMFDNDFNLKIIHFSEANIINEDINKSKFNKDFFDIG